MSLLYTTLLIGQPATTMHAVPNLVRINSTFHPANGAAAAAHESVTLAVYAEQTGGQPTPPTGTVLLTSRPLAAITPLLG